jgi:hypothetical protein
MPLLSHMPRYDNILGPETSSYPYGANSIRGRRGYRYFIALQLTSDLGNGSAPTPALLKMWHEPVG